jgi:hypothetical protein
VQQLKKPQDDDFAAGSDLGEIPLAPEMRRSSGRLHIVRCGAESPNKTWCANRTAAEGQHKTVPGISLVFGG